MVKASVITLPNGTKIEVSPNLSPDQITAMITALTRTPVVSDTTSGNDDSGEIILTQRSVEEIWSSSKKEQVAIFIRTYMSDTLWFNAKDIMDQQIATCRQIIFGETSAIGTYLQRLFETGHLDKRKTPNSRNVSYKMTQTLISEYPHVSIEKMSMLMVEQ